MTVCLIVPVFPRGVWRAVLNFEFSQASVHFLVYVVLNPLLKIQLATYRNWFTLLFRSGQLSRSTTSSSKRLVSSLRDS